MSNSSKMNPTNEAIKMQIAKIAVDGNRPHDWKTYIDDVKLKAHGMDESKRNLVLSYLYYSAFKVIPKTSKSSAHAQMLVDYALIKSGQSVADADNLLSYGRTHLRQFAIVHIASAELALKIGNKEQAKKYIKSAYFYGAEPTYLIKEAAKRLCKGFHQLLCDQDKDSSSSSGHESSEPELSGECSGSYFRTNPVSKHQEHSLSNLPGLKYDTKELQEGLDLFSTIKGNGNELHHLKSRDEDPDHTSPVKNFDHRDGPSSTSPVMPKTPKTPAFSSQIFQNIFKMKRSDDSSYLHGDVTDEHVIKQSSDVVSSEAGQSASESLKVLKENSGLLNMVTPFMKKKVEGVSDSVSHKMRHSSSVSKLNNVALQPPRRVKVDNSAKLDFDEEKEDSENSVDTVNGTQFNAGTEKTTARKALQDGFFSTPASTIINASNRTALVPLQFANSNTYSVHKTTKVGYDTAKNQCDSEVRSLRTNAVERKLFANDHVSSQKVPDSQRAQNVISNQSVESKGLVECPRSEQRHVQSWRPDPLRHDDEKRQPTRKEANDIGISNERRDGPPQHSVLPQNTPVQQRVQSGHKEIYVNNKAFIATRLIGRGGSAKVFLVQDPDTFEMKALKRVDLSGASPQILDSYRNEIALLKKLQACDCVIRLFDSEYDQCKKKLLVVMEYGETDLANFIAKNGSIKNQDELYPVTVCYLWGNMVKAVRAMHKEGVIHSDLKPANFILVSGNIKLIDFGIANSIQQDKTSMLKDHTVGTPSYMSPEALMANDNTDHRKPLYKIGFKSDVWSLGCILYQMVYGQTPFQGCRYKLEAIVNPSHVIDFPPTNYEALTDILQKCLTRDVKTRPTTEQLMMHPYLTKQRADTAVNNPISNLMSEGASIATASPRSQQAFCVKFQKAMEQMKSS